MSSAQKIRSIIKSTNNTSKITQAMKMVAASKLGKTQKRMMMIKPYAEKMLEVVGHIVHSKHFDYVHPYMLPREEKERIGIIVVSTDRGLCGGLNINLFKLLINFMKNKAENNIAFDFCLFGNKAVQFFRPYRSSILGQVTGLGDVPGFDKVIGPLNLMLQAYNENKIDSLYLAGNKYVNTMVQKPYIQKLLPLVADDFPVLNSHSWDYLYEPDPKTLFDSFLLRNLEIQVFQALVENIACEQASRMLAMQNATDNAKKIISELQLSYNKARQASITRELAEIVAGAAAVDQV